MGLFTQIKMGVSVKEAAEYYGLEVNHGNMVCCPFHADRTPSMKLNEDYFYCFGCGAHGDVIDLVAKLFNLSSYDAAKKLAYDFGIDPDKPPAAAALRKPKYPLAKAFQNETLHCQRILCDYLHLLERWKVQCAPKTPEEFGAPIGTQQSGSDGERTSSGMSELPPQGGNEGYEACEDEDDRFARADLEHILLCVDDDMRMEALRQTNYVKSIVTAQGKMDLERKGKQSYQGWMFARLLAFSNGDLQALYDRSDGFYRRQLVLTAKEKPAGRVDDPDLAEKMKAEVEGIFLWVFEGLQRLVANNFKFTESQRTRDNREAVKRDNNNVFDFLESEGYIRMKADCTISSKDLYEIYRMWCEENNLTPLKRRSFSESVIANQRKYNLEYCNKIINAAGRRVWGFFGIEAIAKPNINGFSDASERTYVPEDWR